MEARDNFVSLLQEAFFRTQTDEESAELITTPGPNPGIPGGQQLQKNKDTKAVDFLNANIFGGANSGQFMTVRISRVASSPGCGNAVNAINAAGGLVPALVPAVLQRYQCGVCWTWLEGRMRAKCLTQDGYDDVRLVE